jgi:hypothetical protein
MDEGPRQNPQRQLIPADLRQEPQMQTLRFGRKLSLPSTIAIKHQVRTLMAQYEAMKAAAEARTEALPGKPSPAVPPPEVSDNIVSAHIRPM